MKKIVVACASGVATSQAVASKVNRLLKENHVDAAVKAVNIRSLDTELRDSVAIYFHYKNDKGISGSGN